MKKTKFTLKVTLLSYEGAILNAIKEAKIANKEIVKLGIPRNIQIELTDFVECVPTREFLKTRHISKIYGIPVETTNTLQITTEFTRFSRKGSL